MEVLPGPLPDGRRFGGDEGLGSRLPCAMPECSNHHGDALCIQADSNGIHKEKLQQREADQFVPFLKAVVPLAQTRLH